MSRFAHQLDDDLALLPPLPRDAGALFAAVDRSRDRLGRWLPWVKDDTGPGHNRDFLRERCRTLGRRESFTTLIEHRGEIAGVVGFNTISNRDRTGEIGYWLADGHEGLGVMARCVRAHLAHGHHHLRLNRIEVRSAVDNARSRGVAERCGLALEAIAANGEPLPDGRVVDQAIYASVEAPADASAIEFTIPTSLPDVRLALQQPHHARPLFELCEANRPRLEPFLQFIHRVRRVRDVRRLIRSGWDEAADGDRLQCVVLVDGRVAGGIGAGGMSGVARYAELGYWLGARHEGRGVMTAALSAMVEHLWQSRPELVRLQLRVLPGNARSERLAERCGFKREGLLRSDYRIRRSVEDSLLFGMPRPA